MFIGKFFFYIFFQFRNSVGSIITEGILNEKITKFEKYVKNMKNVVQICYLKKDDVDNKMQVRLSKIPVNLLFIFLTYFNLIFLVFKS